ncbi:MAG: hypothetical protein JNM76_09730 [Betaproteobacteria bacterium]|nr:hypothetical protein [Betaproteobacteria bacterium]
MSPLIHAFTGRWRTSFGVLTLNIAGTRVTGHYGEHGALAGTLDGDTLSFDYEEPGERGSGAFTLKRAGRFVGRYLAEGGDTPRPWIGERGWDGLYETTFGRLRLLHAADGVEGFYEAAGPAALRGRADGDRLHFHYEEKNASGEGYFVMAEDGESFTGQWRASGDEEWSDWTGTRMHAERGIQWLFVLEAHWQKSLADNDYAFGDMLREVFARLANIRVRHRIFHDADSLAHWCRELMYLAEPAVLVIASHGTERGLSVHGEIINTPRIMQSLATAETLKYLHFSACLVANDEARSLKSPPFPVSGYTTSVDWGASAMIEFTLLDMVLNRGMTPDAAAAMLPKLVTYALDEAPERSPYPPAGFRFFPKAK